MKEGFEKEKSNEALADELDALQADKNDGRGVNCVQQIVLFLWLGDVESARAVCGTEYDKIRNYPDIKNWLKENLFAGEKDHPWRVSEKFERT